MKVAKQLFHVAVYCTCVVLCCLVNANGACSRHSKVSEVI